MEPRAYTRCTACQAVLPLVPATLAQGGGTVRCGSCGKTFNAVSHLFTQYPDADASPLPAESMPPLIQPVTRDGQVEIAGPPEPGPELVLDPAPAPAWARVLWPVAAGVMLILAGLQMIGPDSWRVPIPGLTGTSPKAPADPNQVIQVISRDLHAHPTLDNAIIISAMLSNRGEREIPYPILEVRLFDASQQVIGLRRLEPAEYIADTEILTGGLRPNVLLPVVLEMVVEASEPAGFHLQFY